jgi:hypothetical protein
LSVHFDRHLSEATIKSNPDTPILITQVNRTGAPRLTQYRTDSRGWLIVGLRGELGRGLVSRVVVAEMANAGLRIQRAIVFGKPILQAGAAGTPRSHNMAT